MFHLLFQGVAWAQETGNATMPTLPAADYGWGSYLQALAMVFFLLALIFGGFYALKRFGPSKGRFFGRGLLTLEAQLSLGPRRSIAVVRFLNKRLVLGVTEQQINLLSETTADNEIKDSSFSNTLRAHRADPD